MIFMDWCKKEIPLDRESLVKYLSDGTKKVNHFGGTDEVIYTNVSKKGDRISFYHGCFYRNSFMPILTLKMVTAGENCTLVKKFWRWHFATHIWYLLMLTFMGMILLKGILIENMRFVLFGLTCILFFSGFGLFGTWLERKKIKKITEFFNKKISVLPS